MGGIARETGLVFECEQSKIFNLVLNKHRLDFLDDLVNVHTSRKLKKAIGYNNAKSMSLIYSDNGEMKYKKLVGNKYVDFMKEYDKDNILLDFNWSDIDEDFIRGFEVCKHLYKKGVMLNMCNYGDEGLDYLNVNENEIILFLNSYDGVI